MDLEYPSVITTIRIEEFKFIFQVRAYRRLTEFEMKFALSSWMKKERLKKLPKNKLITVISSLGFDDQDL